MPTSAALKLVGDQHVGQMLEHQQLSMGGPVPSTQVLHSRPELGGDEVTSPSSSSPGIYLGMLKPPFFLLRCRLGRIKVLPVFSTL